MRIDPRLRVLYILAVAIGVFFLRSLSTIGALLALQCILWLVVGLPPRRLPRQLVKLWGFVLFMVVSYALVASENNPSADRWYDLHLGAFRIPINITGVLDGVEMILRVFTVVIASQVARAGDPRAIAAGLGKLGLPQLPAATIDAVLALIGGNVGGRGGGGGGGRGGGGGGGGGGRRHQEAMAEKPGESFWAALKRLGRGDIGALSERIERQIARAEQHVKSQGISEKAGSLVREVSVIAGIGLTMLGIKALKILPSLPFAPGHKVVLLTPLYIVVKLLARSRFSATLTGLTMGTVAFLMGDGKYGIFEILKHITPGLICDLVVPILLRGGRTPRALTWYLMGGLISVGRFATIFLVVLAVQAPAIAWAILVPGVTVHVVLGVLSGYVTAPLVRAFSKRVSDDTMQPKATQGSESSNDVPSEP